MVNLSYWLTSKQTLLANVLGSIHNCAIRSWQQTCRIPVQYVLGKMIIRASFAGCEIHLFADAEIPLTCENEHGKLLL